MRPGFLRRHYAVRRLGMLALLASFPIQSLFTQIWCHAGLTRFWLANALVMLVPLGMLAWPSSWPCLVSAAMVLIFSLWANAQECAPYAGGGASMAYVVVFLFGWPMALIGGMVIGYVTVIQPRQQKINKP